VSKARPGRSNFHWSNRYWRNRRWGHRLRGLKRLGGNDLNARLLGALRACGTDLDAFCVARGHHVLKHRAQGQASVGTKLCLNEGLKHRGHGVLALLHHHRQHTEQGRRGRVRRTMLSVRMMSWRVRHAKRGSRELLEAGSMHPRSG